MKKMANDMNMPVPDFVVTNKMAVSLAIGGKNPTIVISRDLINLLDKDELETVLAHELAHIKNGDAKIKTIASVFKHILFFDPLIKFVEPAIHREKEFLADEISAKITKNPTALVSALLKIYHILKIQGGRNLASSLVIVGSGKGIFSKFPPLEKRVERLLKIEAALK
jgi:heat shock protein HtpX